jgi:hypothetical protein
MVNAALYVILSVWRARADSRARHAASLCRRRMSLGIDNHKSVRVLGVRIPVVKDVFHLIESSASMLRSIESRTRPWAVV